MIQVEGKPGDSKQDDDQNQHLDGSPPTCQSPELLLLGGGSNVSRTPQVVGDHGVGRHGDQQRDQELYQEHDQRYPGPEVCRENQLTSMESGAGEGRFDGVVDGPGDGEEDGQTPDESQLPVAVPELGPDVEGRGDDLVPVHGDGRHRERGDEHGDALSEGDKGTHEASERPIIQH